MSLETILRAAEEKKYRPELEAILGIDSAAFKQGMSEERLRAAMPALRNQIAYWREYPDQFVDYMKGPDSKFNLYMYQRIFLRICARHRNVCAVYPRGYSKSFLSMLILVIRCVLFPGVELSVTTGGKEQAASITIAKVEEICRRIPGFQNEIDWRRGESKKGKDTVEYKFKNGSKLDILAIRESSRGQRRHGILGEEFVLIDQDGLNEIVIPTTVINRVLPDGTMDPAEVINQSQIFISTAGYKNTFAYDLVVEHLVRSLIEPDEVMIMGGTYITPIVEGLQPENFLTNLKMSGTYNEDSFDREYNSLWTGDAENAFFSSEAFDRHRNLKQPEYEHSGRSSKNAFYVLGVDVGRFDCTTEICVFKVTPQPNGSAIKSLVNIYSYEATDFEEQAINIKRLYYKYKARIIAIDANGVGAGLVDFFTKAQVDPETGEDLIPFGVENDEDGKYKAVKRSGVYEPDALFLIKATAPINTEIYAYIKTQMYSGKIKMLEDPTSAKVRLNSTKVGQQMSTAERNKYMIPFELTERLKEQTLNLIQENEGINILLKQSNKGIKKDKFSAFGYGLYYIKTDEERKNKRKKSAVRDFMFFS